jgi:lysophospholipase L1-like esterase
VRTAVVIAPIHAWDHFETSSRTDRLAEKSASARKYFAGTEGRATRSISLAARREGDNVIKLATAVIAASIFWFSGSAAAQTWQGAWGHPPTAYNDLPLPARSDGRPAGRPVYAPLPPYKDTTVRQVVRISAAARVIRLRFTNEFGTKALHIGAAHVALAGDNGAILPGSDHVITFTGKTSANIPPGSPMLSDVLAWDLPVFARLAISVHYPGETLPPAHTLFTLNAWQSAGDHTSDLALPSPAPARSGLHVSQIDIVPAWPGKTLVTFGDSITEGVVSTPGAFRSWPDRLAERLQADAATRGWSIVNAGMGSNRLLHDRPSTSALSRFDRDVLAVPGVKAVIVLLGINDIQYTHRYPAEAVRADQEIAALRQLIDRAHAAGLRIYGGTITAFEGSPDYTQEGEADRQATNAFIRSGAFDGVVDFDAVMRDPANPAHLRATLESDGHLHPNDEGYILMGNSIDLSLFAK